MGGTIRIWNSDLLYPETPDPGPRNHTDPTGPDPNYYDEGFLTLQYEISKEILTHHLTKHNIIDNEPYPTISMRRFPYPSWINDDGLLQTSEAIIIAVCFMFLSLIVGTIKDIVDERERRLKEMMMIMGSPNCVHWTAWFFKTFTILLIMIGLVTFFFVVPGTKVLRYTSAFLFYIFLMLYACGIVTFCFLVSVFFANVKVALFAAVVYWCVTFVPFVILEFKHSDVITKTFSMLGLNTAVCFGFKVISKFESVREGLQFHNIFVSPFHDNLTMGLVFIMLIVDTILYLLLALYFEGLLPRAYEITKPWCYPCKSRKYLKSDYDRRIPESDTYQRGPVLTKAVIKVRNLTKVYHNQILGVHNLSMDIFEGHITVFLGQSGCGKTTVLLMITGTIPPNDGSIFINDFNLATHKNQIRSSMTYCPQYTALFQDLTVREHLYFFCKLKGTQDNEERNDEIILYLELLDLTEYENKRVAYLTNNIKRKLCVAIALCGKAKICILDEPTSGMDSITKRRMWNFIRSLKLNKTILLSTKSMDEADYLGDRIAVLSNGKLQCCGRNTFLKQKLGAGYHLIIKKIPTCFDINKLTDFLKIRVPSVKLIRNQNLDTVFLLDKHDSVIFANLLADLEIHSAELRIYSYEIAMNTIDEVLMRSNTNDVEIDVGDLKSDKPFGFEKINRLRGLALSLNQFTALIIKKALLSVRSWIILVILLLFPICSILLMYLTGESRKLKRQDKMVISLDKYRNPTIVIQASSADNNSYISQYLTMIRNENRIINIWGSKIVTKLLKEATLSETNYRKKFVIGASSSTKNDTLTAWYNNQPYHSSPLALQYLMNAIMKTQLSDDDYAVTFVNYPLSYAATTKISRLVEINKYVLDIPCTIGVTVAIISALYIIFCIKDRITNSKHLQMISGVSIYLYWLCTFIWDLCTFLVAAVCIIVILIVLGIEGFLSLSVIGPLFVLFLLYGLAMLPMMYLFSRCFHEFVSAFSIMALINMLLGPITFIVYQNFIFAVVGPNSIYETLHWFSLLVPSYALTSGLLHISYKSTLYYLCDIVAMEASNYNVTQSHSQSACDIEDKCCDLDENYLSWDNYGIGSEICYLILSAIFFIILHLLIENRVFYRNKSTTISFNDDVVDKDVIEEKRRTNSGEINSKNYQILLNDLSKVYEQKLVLNQLCLGIQFHHCFGFLGAKGAGKTTILKILTGDTQITDGTAWIYGWNINNSTKEACKFIGYCPQVDAVLDDLTGKEILIFYCMLRGMKLRNCKIAAQILSKELGFENQLNMLIKKYPFGTKRKLSVAIALIGDPPILFFDEPTTGIDNLSKSKIWSVIIRQRNAGKCIIVTSKNIDECETVCTRMAVIVNGSLRCLGPPKYLKRKFSFGYTLTIKMPSDSDEIHVEPVKDFIKANFPIATLKECYQNTLIFFIISKSMKWSAIFDIMEHGKRILNIEEYSIAQSSLEQMFLQFTKLQNYD
ncbi:phospholipid-transporting ATPase ABCA3-like isoform X2 [Onthophagus taurus]